MLQDPPLHVVLRVYSCRPARREAMLQDLLLAHYDLTFCIVLARLRTKLLASTVSILSPATTHSCRPARREAMLQDLKDGKEDPVHSSYAFIHVVLRVRPKVECCRT